MSLSEHEENVLTKQLRIAEVANKHPDEPILSLAHYIDLEWLYIAYRHTRKDGATGVDNQNYEDYGKNLKENLTTLLNRFKSGDYKAPPSRRIYIDKLGGKEKRPIAIPTFEDKVLQRAVLMVLEPVYEQVFYPFSYGFRKGKSPHQALKYLYKGMTAMQGGWIIDMDIRKYFDSIDHRMLRETYKQRVGDGVIRRVMGKWLKAGIMEGNQMSYPESGAMQGGVISPMLSNIYLHEVLDSWFVQDVQPRMKGRSSIVRFADDSVLVFSNKSDAERVMKILPKRFEKFKLTLHPEKTKLLSFTNPGRSDSCRRPGTFNFLGFTIYWGKSRKGANVIKWKTDKSRVSRFLKQLNLWLNSNRHIKRKEQHKTLCNKLRGFFQYFGVSFNTRTLYSVLYFSRRLWFNWLRRRSNRYTLTWDRFEAYLKAFPLPKPKIYHSLWCEPLF